MKSFAVLAGLLFMAVMGISGSPHHSHPPPGPLSEEMKKNFDECRTEMGLTIEEERELHKKHDFNHEKMRCMPACLMKKDGFLEEGNKLNIEKMLEAEKERFGVDPVEAKEIIEECAEKAEKQEDECDFAKSFQKCMHKKMGPLKGPHGHPHGPPHHGPMTDEMKKNLDECREELGMSIEEERELHRNRDFKNDKLRCMPACLMKKEGILEEGKKFNEERLLKDIKEKFPEVAEDVDEVIEECQEKAKEKKDECEFAQTFMWCTHKKMKELKHSKESNESDEE